jgi:hypothetical protein
LAIAEEHITPSAAAETLEPVAHELSWHRLDRALLGFGVTFNRGRKRAPIPVECLQVRLGGSAIEMHRTVKRFTAARRLEP